MREHNDLLTYAQQREHEARLRMTPRERIVLGVVMIVLGFQIAASFIGNPL